MVGESNFFGFVPNLLSRTQIFKKDVRNSQCCPILQKKNTYPYFINNLRIMKVDADVFIFKLFNGPTEFIVTDIVLKLFRCG